ncbi:MAG: ABC transporter permease [Halorubrum sp.]|uniref:ABC transporter permease n=1 Tax=Halorubrum sp. TaxID=1879286 RepID=UPI003970B42B
MSQRNRTTTRGRIRISGFDSSVIEQNREFVDWDESIDSNVSADRWTRAWQRFRRNRTALLGLAIILLMAFLAVFARPIDVFGITVQPFSIAPYDPNASNFNALEQPPSLQYPFGTDWSGKDIFSRVIVGGRMSLTIGLIAVSLALGVGVPLGSIAGYFGGWIDEFIMRIVDVLYAFPFLVLAIAFIAIFGQGFWRMIGALVIVSWIGYARLIRGEILSVKENEYVSAAEALGARDRSIIFRHIVPNAIAPVIVQATLGIGTYVLSAAALGFLGLGLEPGSAEWGSMLSSGRESLVEGNYWITFFPGVAIFLFVMSINLVGDGVRDALDPQSDTASERLR